MEHLDNTSALKLKLNVQPVFVSLMHIHEFMGPCRYGCGKELSYEYDRERAMEANDLFIDDLEKFVDHNLVNLLPPKFLEWHEDFYVKEEEINDVLEKNNIVDVYLISGTRLVSYVSTIIAKRSHRAIAFCPLSNSIQSRLGGIDASANLHALGIHDICNALNYDDLNKYFRLKRAIKAISKTKLMFAVRTNVLSYGCVSSFINLQDITDKFGMEILNCSGVEFFKDLDEMSEEDNKRAQEIADALVAEAHGMHMPAENVVNDVRFYIAVKNKLNASECNAFTIPCFEMCATRQLNARHLTFCLANSLLKDEGIPAACAADVGSVVSLSVLMNLFFAAPHMGNCMVMLKDIDKNQMRILHDVPCRRMKGFDKPDLPIEYVSFTQGKWGATMRYNFAQDSGEKITMINMSPRMDKMMIATGTINGCDDFLREECRLAVDFTVADARDFHAKQEYFGQHYAWVYGDVKEDLIKFCNMMNIEAVIA